MSAACLIDMTTTWRSVALIAGLVVGAAACSETADGDADPATGGSSTTGGQGTSGGAGGATNEGGAAGSVVSPLPQEQCHGLAGVYEVIVTDGYFTTMEPWLSIQSEAEGCVAWVAELGHDGTGARLEIDEDTLLVSVVGDALGGSETNTMHWWWWWDSFALELTPAGTLAGEGTADYHYDWSEEDIWGAGETSAQVSVAAPTEPTELEFVYPDGREAGLPWDAEVRLEALRPMPHLAASLQRFSQADAWAQDSERVATTSLNLSWSELSGSSRVAQFVADTVDLAGTPMPETGPEYLVYEVNEPESLIVFSDVPPASWGFVEDADPAPGVCAPSGCVRIHPGCVGSSGIAFRLDTGGATRIVVDLAVPSEGEDLLAGEPYIDSYDDGLTIVALAADGTAVELAEESVDLEGGIALTGEISDVDEVAVEIHNRGSCHWGGPSLFPIEARAE